MPNHSSEEILYTIALSSVKGVGAVLAKNLIAYCGSAEAVFKTSKSKLEKIPLIGKERAALIHAADMLREAEEEMKFIEKYQITPLLFISDKYPQRLKECSDSPIILFYKGNADLNVPKVVAVIGTRRATDYGKEETKKIISDLAAHDVLIVSGLAYGIDIAAHNAALENNLNTIGVLGHGLNTIYPQQHKSSAKKMVEHGGLLTEYLSTEKMQPHNFPDRNRIVAGMSDAVVIIESANDGGAILTANIAQSYNRDVFALPGKSTDKWSKGCNTLIKTNRAMLIESGEDLLNAMNWNDTKADSKKSKPQRELSLNLSDDEKKIYSLLNELGETDIDKLSDATGLNSSILAATLLEMEMNSILVSLPGKRYKLV